jgi:pimeloyl-ACP methyl ester carboxylesterase
LVRFSRVWLGPVVGALILMTAAEADESATVALRGKDQKLHLYGPEGGRPAVLASGDGGFVHLAPEVAELLGGQGFRVVGLDSKAYLSSFTSGERSLAATDVPGDFHQLVDFARKGGNERVLLVGVSEGAGLSVLAAADSSLQPLLSGVVGLGLPDVNELGWRFRDSVIYITHKAPKEPTFRASDYVPKMGLPLAALHSTHDEFVPLDEVKALLALPGGPRRLWVIEAADHRFSDNLAELRRRLLEAIEWTAAAGR